MPAHCRPTASPHGDACSKPSPYGDVRLPPARHASAQARSSAPRKPRADPSRGPVRGARLQSLVLTSVTHQRGRIVPLWRGRSPFDHDRWRQRTGRRPRRPMTITRARRPTGSAARRACPGHDPGMPGPTPTTAARAPRKSIVRLVSPGPYIQFTCGIPAGSFRSKFPGSGRTRWPFEGL